MNPEKRRTVLFAVMMALMLVCVAWSVGRMRGQQQDAAQAAQDAARCLELAEHITELRSQRTVAAASDQADERQQELAGAVNRAAEQASLDAQWQQGMRIEHRRAVRIDDTPYMRKPALLIMKGLTLEQLTTLLHHLTYDSAYTAEQIQIDAPSGEAGGNRWDADVTLSYLIYSPTPNQGQGR